MENLVLKARNSMKLVEEESAYFVETSRYKFKVNSRNGEVKSFKIYKNGDYYDVVNIPKDEIEDMVILLVSEFLKLDCGGFIN